jgi:cytochrome c556
MIRRIFTGVLSVVVCVAFSATAFSQVKPQVLVKQRQAAMTLQGKYFGPLFGMVQGKVPYNAEIVARNAAYLDVLTRMPWDGFDASTAGEKSEALPVVFSEPDKFKKAAEELQAAVVKLVAESKGGNEAAIKAAIGSVGKTCSGCHDHYRVKL